MKYGTIYEEVVGHKCHASLERKQYLTSIQRSCTLAVLYVWLKVDRDCGQRGGLHRKETEIPIGEVVLTVEWTSGDLRRYLDTESPAHALVLALTLLSEDDPVARSLKQFPESALIDL